MKKASILYSALIAGLSLFTSCGGKSEEVERITNLITITANAEDSLVDKTSRVQTQAHAGQFVFRTDSLHEYAATMRYNLNDSLINSNLRVVFNFWARTSNPIKGDGLAVSFQDDAAANYWGAFELINYGAKPNEWINIVDSISITPDKVNKTGLFFKFFGFNANKKAVMDFDDINITVKRIEHVIEE